MKGYGQFCPVAKAAEVFCERWTALILRDLAAGASRFSELQRGVPLMSPTLLSRRLKQLEAEGIVTRERATEGRGWRYGLTSAGREFAPLVEALGVWGQRWSRRDLDEGEIDLGLLIWALERQVRGEALVEALGPGPRAVQLAFSDQPANKRDWWFLHEAGGTQLCLNDPGFEVDLYLAASLADMIRIWRGDLSLRAALGHDRLEALGSARARRALDAWLNLHPLTQVSSQRIGHAVSSRAIEVERPGRSGA